MSKLDIIITLIAVLYLPVLIIACVASYRLGITSDTRRGGEFNEFWAARERSLTDDSWTG